MGETLKVDIPFHELSFKGVPFCTNIVSLECVQFSLKQFNLVLIFKDFTNPPLHINSIPSRQLDDVKNWLDLVDIPLGEGPINLNWGPIMKTINESPYDFFQQGSWQSFLSGGDVDSNADEGSDSESEFEADPEELQSEESSADASEYDGSDASNNTGSGSGYDDDGDDGDNWEELEMKAT
ncbi:hypothetical protein BDR07DRAFT_1275574 [Suillus spraguei]|nr:hypothetical protein BDR07DRAFT_1275574 [Suillus spraguei]